MEPVEIIDTHCHLDLEHFHDDLDGILGRSREGGVTDFVIPGFIASGWHGILKLCTGRPCLHPALGLHPIYLDRHQPGDLAELQHLIRRQTPVAIGEIGLDFQGGMENYNSQLKLFQQQLDIAAEEDLPVLLHVRKAHDQVLAALRRSHFSKGGIVHAFNGSRQQADCYMEFGFKFGYGGTLTYDRARRIRKLSAELPLDSIVLETDAPDIPLAGRRGYANSPEYLVEILGVLASLRSESEEEIAAQTTINARNILDL
ncbi:MAG: TatD family hydrolase [Deltaproteobacteria bacterium]|nr:TatD family hydrolase [Deltaproteobacteria bacterium]